MERIIIHWTGGAARANATDLMAYHFCVEADGTVVEGVRNPEANLDVSDGQYAAHTRALNTGSIGVAMCGMHGAREAPFNSGPYPLTETQIAATAALCADLCATYGIEVTPRTVLTHAEVQPTLGVWQRSKWDVTWLPDMERPGDPIAVGARLRARIAANMPKGEAKAPESVGFVAALMALLRRIFGGKA